MAELGSGGFEWAVVRPKAGGFERATAGLCILETRAVVAAMEA